MKRSVGSSWRMDETYVRVKGQWIYLYRTIDKDGDTVDFLLSKTRDEAAANGFFEKVIANNGLPERVVMNKSDVNLAGLVNINTRLWFKGLASLIEIFQVKYLNSIVEHPSR